MAKKFFYVCAGILMLALAYHLGASTAGAQAPSNPVVAMNGGDEVITANGDIYIGTDYSGAVPIIWTRAVNIFAGGAPVSTTTRSWGSLKAKYR